ncbi:hypothetical protein [Parasphingorhabdus sp.]|uniref:hypothetical protein n=1 Tax=Parasphingorhabdus sp. TaxID=2709688 RepID=UPI003D2C0946
MTDKDTKARIKNEYLALAKASLKRAKELREVADDKADTYAALEMRQAFEALIYERAIDYLDDLSKEEIRLWRPPLLLKKIVEIDPTADLTIEFSLEKTPGGKDWISLGIANRIGLKQLKKHYFALGSFLHTPSLSNVLKQTNSDKAEALSKLCDSSAELLNKVIGSTLRMSAHEIFGRTELKCSQCATLISRNVAALKTPQNSKPGTHEIISINCSTCIASFDLFYREPDGIVWREQRWQRPCPVADCNGSHEKWIREMFDGVRTTCAECKTECEVRQAFIFRPTSNMDSEGK